MSQFFTTLIEAIMSKEKTWVKKIVNAIKEGGTLYS